MARIHIIDSYAICKNCDFIIQNPSFAIIANLNFIKGSVLKQCDLFAGVGGFHLAFNNVANDISKAIHCVFASEIDTNAKATYALNFPHTPIFGDITQETTQKEIPSDFDILCD